VSTERRLFPYALAAMALVAGGLAVLVFGAAIVLHGQPRLPGPPKNLRIVKGVPMGNPRLPGLTVVLVDGATALKHEPVLNVALEAFIALREVGADVRMFAVTDKLIELREIPESFGTLYVTPSRLAAAVNRTNILRPARIVILTGELPTIENMGFTRDGTRGYLWAAHVAAPVRVLQPIAWTILESPAAGVVHEMIRVEKEIPDGPEAQHVR